MISLTDLFTPSFFMYLGIVLLLVSLAVIYFEHKTREQNKKIAQMLCIVSTLAEDMNSLKGGYLCSAQPNNVVSSNHLHLGKSVKNEILNDLIEVSDEEEDEEDEDEEDEDSEDEDEDSEDDVSEDEDEDEDDTDSEEETGSVEDLEEDLEPSSKDEIKIIKLDMDEDLVEDLNKDLVEDLDQNLEEMDCDTYCSNEIPEMNEKYVEKVLDLKYDLKEDDPTDLKTFLVNVGEEHMEYKKMQLPKLRTIAIEKGLLTSADALKYKKPELLKLLEN